MSFGNSNFSSYNKNNYGGEATLKVGPGHVQHEHIKKMYGDENHTMPNGDKTWQKEHNGVHFKMFHNKQTKSISISTQHEKEKAKNTEHLKKIRKQIVSDFAKHYPEEHKKAKEAAKFSNIPGFMNESFAMDAFKSLVAQQKAIPSKDETQYYSVEFSLWKYGSNEFNCFIYKNNVPIWSHKSHNIFNIDKDIKSTMLHVKALGLNPDNIKVIKKVNGKIVDKLVESFQELEALEEKAPPDPKIEQWIIKNKERFKKQYGEQKGMNILYAKAWKMHNARKQQQITEVQKLTPDFDGKVDFVPRHVEDVDGHVITKYDVKVKNNNLEYPSFHIIKRVQNKFNHNLDFFVDDKTDLKFGNFDDAINWCVGQSLAKQDDQLNEYAVLNVHQRRIRANIARRNKKKLAMARKIKANRIASTEQLLKRARKEAIRLLRKKVAGKMGLKYNELPVTQKIQIDKRVKKKTKLINMLALKLLNKVREKEMARYKKHKLHAKERN